MKKLQKQISFIRGMVENIKQSSPDATGNPLDSALWIENFDPNIQRDSVILRSEQSVNYHVIGQGDVLDLTTYSDFAKYAADNYPELGVYDLVRSTMMTGVEYMLVAQPGANDTYIVFARRFTVNGSDSSPHGAITSEATAVIAWVPYIDPSKEVAIGWREPFHDNEVYPGWYALGTYQNHARYGESIIFVTRPLQDISSGANPALTLADAYTIDENTRKLYHPCYIWQYWDLSNKRKGLNGTQRFWNGLTITDLSDPKYRLWKIRKPSTAIIKEDLVEALTLWKHPDTWTDFSGNIVAAGEGKPIQLLFWESPLKTYNPVTSDGSSTLALADSVIQRDDFYLDKAYENPFFVDKQLGWVESLETLDEDSLYTYGYNTHVRRAKQSEDHLGIFYNGLDLVPFPKKEIGTGAVATPPGWDTGQFFYYKHNFYKVDSSTKSQQMKLLLCLTENRSTQDGSTTTDNFGETIYADAKVVDPYGDELTAGMQNGAVNHGDDGAACDAFVVGTRMPDYLSAEIPRQWIQGESVPFTLTATVNGIEIVLLKDIYKVATHNYSLIESLFCPIAWDKVGGDELVTDDVVIYGGPSLPGIGITDAPYKAMKKTTGAVDERNSALYWMKAQQRYDMYVTAKSRGMFVSRQMLNVPICNGYAFIVNAGGNKIYTVLPNRTREYLYEPFNPTNELALRYGGQSPAAYRLTDPIPLIERETSMEAWTTSSRNNTDHYYLNIVTDTASDSGLNTPYIPELCEGNMVHIGIRIARDFWDDISAMNITAFNLYVSKPDLTKSILRSVGIIDPNDPSPGLYSKPSVTKDNIKDTQNFALVKTWLVEGEGTPSPTDKYYKGAPIRTNAWYDDTTDYIWSVPQEADGSARGALPTFVDHCTAYSLDKNESWTPDFMLWDYPTQGKNLSLNSSGEYWQGMGARLVLVIKGRTFLGGCIDSEGKEDIGLVRYSDVQAGVAAQDIFSEERKMRIGHGQHTAFVFYREQIWFFTRYENYRMQMPNVYDETTWEFLDVVNAGTFSPKTACETPYGLVYANETGVWISDGRIPDNIAAGVLQSYKWLVRRDDNSYPEFDTEVAFLGDYKDKDGNSLHVLNNSEGYNSYLEVTYDYSKDEINVMTPLFMTVVGREVPVREYRLIYNFSNRNWRVESYDIPQTKKASE